MYILEYGSYTPADFKQQIRNLNILKSQDWDRTNVSTESKWRHRIDAAKQHLLDKGIIKKDFDNSFILDRQRIEVIQVIENYME